MNSVLEKYKITFEILNVDDRKILNITSKVIPYFWGYFMKIYPKFLLDEILPEIDKALNGENFDEDAGGIIDFLKIGNETSYFYNSQENQFGIPTIELKEIILEYVNWIKQNELENYI